MPDAFSASLPSPPPLNAAPGAERSLSDCFKLFDAIHRITTTHDAVSRVTLQVLSDFADDNVAYLELRTTPKVICG